MNIRWIGFVMICMLVASTTWGRGLTRQGYPLGERAAGMGGAFISLSGDPASSYYNPAGLAGLQKQGLSLSASLYQASWESYDRLLDLDVGHGDRLQADMDSFTFATFPSSMVYVLPFSSDPAPGGIHHVLSFSVLVPDYDKLEARIERPVGDFAFEMKSSMLTEQQTYWVGPSYAVAFGQDLKLGVSFFTLAHLINSRGNMGMKLAFDDPALGRVNNYITLTDESSAMSISAVLQAGIQVALSDSFELGLTVRSPTLGTWYSDASILQFRSYYAEQSDGTPAVTPQAPGHVDRLETEKGSLEAHHRLPLMIGLGGSYHAPGAYTIALDVTCHLPVQAYPAVRGPVVYPKDPSGSDIIDPERALDPTDNRQEKLVVNANLGAEFVVLPKLLGRVGLFTDLAAVDQDFYDHADTRMDALTLPRLNRFGASLGVGILGEKSTTSIGLVYVYGTGSTFSFNEAFGVQGEQVDVTSHALTAVLAGSADL